MPCRVNCVNKSTGVTYVYESVSYWDKERKQPRNKRVCIGKLDPISGEFIASKRLATEQAAVRDPAVKRGCMKQEVVKTSRASPCIARGEDANELYKVKII